LLERGSIRSRRARVLVSKLPEHVGQRELAVVRDELKWREEECAIEAVQYPVGPANAVLLAIETEHVTEVFTGFGERGRPAEEVAKSAAAAAKAWLGAAVPVDEHLADQLLT
jgi:RNA 3'-terminal phosphate cyclase (ATP)